jgi:NADPH:quinone reductase-like Zn-dependent oxidoreductase
MMFAVYASGPNPDDPLASLELGNLPEPEIPEGWVRVKISHASLNRHDLYTLRGITAHADPIRFPMILGSDGAGTLDDGTPVVLYPVMGSDGWCGDETLDPDWHVLSEKAPGTFADYTAVPKRNALPLPSGFNPLDASVLGTAWLTAYRALFTRANLKPGETVLVQGASGGMSTALIQLARAAGIEVWATSRNRNGRELAERLGAHRTFDLNERLPRKVEAVVDNIGPVSWQHSMESAARGGTVVVAGLTTGAEVNLSLLPLVSRQITICGSIMGTLRDMKRMMDLILHMGIKPEIGRVLPMDQAREGFREMWKGNTQGKIVFINGSPD